MPFLRFPLNRGKAFMRHYASSSEKSPVVAPVKITIAFARLFLLRSTTNFFRLSVPLFVRNANARNFCLRKNKSFELLFYALHFISALRRPSLQTPPLPKKAFLSSVKNLVCGYREGGFCRKWEIILAKNALKIIKEASNVLTNASCGNIIFIPRDKGVP